MVDSQKFFFHSLLVIVSTDMLEGVIVSVLVTSKSSHEVIPVSNDGSVVGTGGLVASVRSGTGTGMVIGAGPGIRTKLPFDAVEVLCDVLDYTINVGIALVVVLLADREDGIVDIKVCAASPVPELDHVIPDALVEFLAPGV
jgi:hypothetical protein